jgi:hypothetical protein
MGFHHLFQHEQRFGSANFRRINPISTSKMANPFAQKKKVPNPRRINPMSTSKIVNARYATKCWMQQNHQEIKPMDPKKKSKHFDGDRNR